MDEPQTDLVRELDKFQIDVHALAVEKGFYDMPRSFPDRIALIHSELSEALAADRCGEFEHVGEELADAVIRILDVAETLDVSIAGEMLRKHTLNLARPHKHGKRY